MNETAKNTKYAKQFTCRILFSLAYLVTWRFNLLEALFRFPLAKISGDQWSKISAFKY